MYSFIIVDDEPIIRKGLLKKIQAFENKLRFDGEAENGEEALQLVNEVDPDIIITDMRMPVLDGKSLLGILQKDFPDKKIIVTSGYSDFEYMQEAISAKVVSYLLKPFSREEIHQTLERAIEAIEKSRLAIHEEKIIHEEKERLSYHSDVHSLLNVILGIHHKDKPLSFHSSNFEAVLAAQHYILMTVYAKHALVEFNYNTNDDLLFLPHPQSDHLAFILLLFQQNQSEHAMLDDALKVATNFIKENTLNKGCVGISEVKNDMSLLYQAHQQTITSLNYRTLTDFGNCFVYSNDVRPTNLTLWDRTNELLFFIESSNAEKVRELVMDFFAFYIRQPTVTIADLKDQCRSIIQEVKTIVHDYLQTQADQAHSTSLDSILRISFDQESLREYFLTVLAEIVDLFKDNPTYSSEHVIDNIKTYIARNYKQELTLEKMSSLFFMNPSYLSHLFKEKTGKNFTDYINVLRIEHAKKLLKNTDDKVYIVAKSLGYDNSKYFFRVFKKLTGFTPEQFRNRR